MDQGHNPGRQHGQKTVAFDAGHLLERGTDVALFDYALGNEDILGNRSMILCPANANLSCLDKFRQRFGVFLYRSAWDLQYLLRDVDLYYRIDHGQRPAQMPPRPPHGKLAVHCVFEATEPHGDIYAAVSSWVAEHRGCGGVPVVPHMVQLPDEEGDLRGELGIPANATVLGRHGGFETFNLPFAREVVVEVLQQRPDIYFLFLNTQSFVEHPRAIFFPPTADLQRKTRFINTCDGMLHARVEGETFGLAVGEFSIRNKPVITWLDGKDKHHIQVLGEKGIYYQTPAELRQILMQFKAMPGDWDAFSKDFSPAPVMQAFAQVFLGQTPAPQQPSAKSRAIGASLRI